MKSTKQRVLPLRLMRAGSTAVALAALLAACGSKEDGVTQAAAKVNKEEITVHQINQQLQRQPGLTARLGEKQAEALSRQVLERLIDQELSVQQAQSLKLDRDPRVVQQIELAKREILARAYAERIGDSVSKPSADEIAKFYNEKPALFKERRVYSLQEMSIEASPEQFESLRQHLQGARSLGEFAEYLKSAGVRFNVNEAVRPAEQLPMNSLDTISRMKDGDTAVQVTPTGLQLLHLASSRANPVDEATARPAVEAFLSNQRKAEAIQKDLKALRQTARIEYLGKFAGRPADPASAPAAVVSAASAASAGEAASAPAVPASDVAKSLGLK
ncbi:EpsD family peptidyl-prolyl cis-trans isomerase [Pelomonas sp. APW6]|uniref:EpsD family peptidyl-prolyl cis-trans isomerase n=1 Tax=Roseateles subflavus TaxID=3053353 RepID=A0ABT7LKI1_9BURK|nr:EpsD family peptidyl-prolyl cis-trans isomerase [Pelomonas sp. APW6]MDL5032949.1 EpsD family peptidyl-prolyl cis-trans isomerase [Pelomonas sp. APW6]